MLLGFISFTKLASLEIQIPPSPPAFDTSFLGLAGLPDRSHKPAVLNTSFVNQRDLADGALSLISV